MPKEKTVGEAVVDTPELPKMVLGEDNKYVVSASNISIAEATEKDMYLTISMRMFST